MGTLTVRPQPEHEDALEAVGVLLQENALHRRYSNH